MLSAEAGGKNNVHNILIDVTPNSQKDSYLEMYGN